MDGDYLLIGIGCNVLYAPSVQSIGSDAGRPATCLAAYAQSGIGIGDESVEVDVTGGHHKISHEIVKEIASGILARSNFWCCKRRMLTFY